MSGGDFLSRWSRRKREVAAAEPATPPPAEAVPPVEPATGADADAAEPGLLSEEEIARLPSIDSLTAETDLTQFLRAGVPLLLRKAALRRMWSVDHGIRDYVSEAREYAYDWNVPGGVPGQGPMLPTDDIQAMVRDIFGGTPAPEGEPEVAAEPDPVAAETGGSPSEDAPVASLSQDDPPPAGGGAPQAPKPEADPVPAARPRRHGGAIPV